MCNLEKRPQLYISNAIERGKSGSVGFYYSSPWLTLFNCVLYLMTESFFIFFFLIIPLSPFLLIYITSIPQIRSQSKVVSPTSEFNLRIVQSFDHVPYSGSPACVPVSNNILKIIQYHKIDILFMPRSRIPHYKFELSIKRLQTSPPWCSSILNIFAAIDFFFWTYISGI